VLLHRRQGEGRNFDLSRRPSEARVAPPRTKKILASTTKFLHSTVQEDPDFQIGDELNLEKHLPLGVKALDFSPEKVLLSKQGLI